MEYIWALLTIMAAVVFTFELVIKQNYLEEK